MKLPVWCMVLTILASQLSFAPFAWCATAAEQSLLGLEEDDSDEAEEVASKEGGKTQQKRRSWFRKASRVAPPEVISPNEASNLFILQLAKDTGLPPKTFQYRKIKKVKHVRCIRMLSHWLGILMHEFTDDEGNSYIIGLENVLFTSAMSVDEVKAQIQEGVTKKKKFLSVTKAYVEWQLEKDTQWPEQTKPYIIENRKPWLYNPYRKLQTVYGDSTKILIRKFECGAYVTHIWSPYINKLIESTQAPTLPESEVRHANIFNGINTYIFANIIFVGGLSLEIPNGLQRLD